MSAADSSAYSEVLERLASEANRGCGLVYELFEQAFSAGVESYLTQVPEEDRDTFIALARSQGYVPTEDLKGPADGECPHFLDPDRCPMGCGDLEDGW